LEKHNEYRAQRKGYKTDNLLKLDKDMAKQLQLLLNGLPEGDFSKAESAFTLAEPAKRHPDKKYKNCQENIFKASDVTDVETIKATKTWFDGNAWYDEALGTPKLRTNDAPAGTATDPKNADRKKLAYKFMRMMW